MPTLNINNIPDKISDVSEDFTKEIIECKNKGKVETKYMLSFRIMPEELAFYKKQKIPIPKYARIAVITLVLVKHLPPKIFNRTCDKCKNKIKTSYAPERPKIYCERCYQQEVY